LYAARVAKKRGHGRPKHTDDPPVILTTTIPKSLDRALRERSAGLLGASGAPLFSL